MSGEELSGVEAEELVTCVDIIDRGSKENSEGEGEIKDKYWSRT